MTRARSKRVAGSLALLLAVYVAALLFLFPASVAWRIAEARLDLPVAVSTGALTGGIWSGRADAVRVDRHHLGAVTWRLQPGSLLGGRLGLALGWQLEGDRIDARVRLGRRSAEAVDVRGGLDAGRIQDWFELPLLLDGRLTLDLQRLRWSGDAGFEEAAGALLWAGAAGGLPRPIALGDYGAQLDAADGALVARIESGPGSPLEVGGSAAWHPAGEYRVDLEVRPTPDAHRNLVAALDSVARRESDGGYRLQLTGR
ncbi:MAG: type II secretion system protein N [Thioalkalivibrio sp.]|nr:type II secretion system protein N [Thioalkalivibrio sp.]